MILLRSQKNELFETIKMSELETFNFEWNNGEDSSILRYKDTNYFFSIDLNYNTFECIFSPDSDIIVNQKSANYWSNVVAYFKNWLKYLEREISQPDLWAEIERIKELGSVEYEIENTAQQFSYQEIKQVQTGIEEIRKYLLDVVNNDEEDSEIINEKLDYLIESSERMGKKDWANIFYGALVSLSISLVLDPQQGQTIVTLFKNAVSGIIKFISIAGV